MLRTVILLVFIFLAVSPRACAEGLSTLIDVGKSQQSMQQTLKEETDAYEAVKRGVEAGRVKKGQTKSEIRSAFGKPVIIQDGEGGSAKWVYKPGYASHFDGIKINLLFDREEKLAKIEVINRSR